MIRTLLVAALLCVVYSSAQACDVMRPCYGNGRPLFGVDQTTFPGKGITKKPLRHRHFLASTSLKEITHHNTSRVSHMPPGLRRVMAEGAGRIVAHPPGCPARAFCGCGAAVRVFGKPVRSLWLAAEWLRRFPRTTPAPGTVAVRRDRHHIVVLERRISGSTWLVYDANSGRHRTRVHPRSIAGWVVVDPRGS